jgi:agmatine/peptidylarginine deiminase
MANMIAAATEATVRPLVVTSDVHDEQLQVVPEYDRALERVLISFPDAESLHWNGLAGEPVPSNAEFVHAAFHELLVAMPDYTEISIVFRVRDRAAILEWDQLFETHSNLRLHVMQSAADELDMWSQDFGEFIRINGDDRFLVSAIPHSSMGASHHMAEARHRIAASIFGEAKVVTARFVFEGGNLLFDRVNGRLRVLIGENDIRFSKDSLARQGFSMSERTVAETISKQFGGAEVVVLRGRQTERLPHIDQAMILLRGGVAVLTTLDDDSQEARLLEGYREQLESLRYRILELPHSAADIEQFRTSVNAVPFTHRDSGKDMVIFPVFPGEVREDAPTILRESDLIGKASATYKAFRAARYHPLPVRDVAHAAGGNIHCITNVIY